MEKFQVQYTIDYLSLNPDLTATLPRLMYFVQETSTRHTESTRFPMQWYVDHMRGWLITNWSIRIYAYPKLNDLITVKTFPIKFKGTVGERGFEVFSADNTLLLTTHSNWIYADLSNQKLLRPPAEMIAGYGPLFESPTDRNMDFGPVHSENTAYELAATREFYATRRDTDTNFHVNNIKYMEWAFDNIPDQVYNANRAKEVKAAYKKECKAGELVLSEFYVNRDNPLDCVSIFKKAADSSVTMAEIYSLWGK